MSTCEKCWADARLRYLLQGGTVTDHYRELIAERKAKPCTAAEQRGHPYTPPVEGHS